MRNILTAWSAIAAIAICPFFCLGEACSGSSGAEEASRGSCCPRCCSHDGPADDDQGEHDSTCTSDCLCKGALPVKPPVELAPPAANDLLSVEPLMVGMNGVNGNPEWNRSASPRSPNDDGRGLRIALCSFLC